MSRTRSGWTATANVAPPSDLLTCNEADAQVLYAGVLKMRRRACAAGAGVFTVLGVFVAALGLALVGTLTPGGGGVGAVSLAVGIGLLARALREERCRGEYERELARLVLE